MYEIDYLNLKSRYRNALIRYGITTISDLIIKINDEPYDWGWDYDIRNLGDIGKTAIETALNNFSRIL